MKPVSDTAWGFVGLLFFFPLLMLYGWGTWNHFVWTQIIASVVAFVILQLFGFHDWKLERHKKKLATLEKVVDNIHENETKAKFTKYKDAEINGTAITN